jgi:plastocyanin
MSYPRIFMTFAAAAILVGCGSSTGPNTPAPGGGTPLPANGVSIVLGAQNKGTAAFSPSPITISLASATGGTVKWFNNDESSTVYGNGGVTHNINADDASFTSGDMAPGTTFEHIFTVAGTYPYHCSIHPTMKGTVTVTQ